MRSGSVSFSAGNCAYNRVGKLKPISFRKARSACGGGG